MVFYEDIESAGRATRFRWSLSKEQLRRFKMNEQDTPEDTLLALVAECIELRTMIEDVTAINNVLREELERD